MGYFNESSAVQKIIAWKQTIFGYFRFFYVEKMKKAALA